MSRKLVSVLCNISGTLILLLVIALCLPMVLPKVLDYEVYHVVSGSMEPEIPVGSLVLVKTAAPETIPENTVIAFRSGGSVVVHRVMQNKLVEGVFVTKGGCQSHRGQKGSSLCAADRDRGGPYSGSRAAAQAPGGKLSITIWEDLVRRRKSLKKC